MLLEYIKINYVQLWWLIYDMKRLINARVETCESSSLTPDS